MLRLTQAVVPAVPTMGRRAREVSLGLQPFAALMLSHMGSIRAAVCACNTRPVSSVRLLVWLASAGPQLTGACSTALHGTSAGMSRVTQHSRRCALCTMQEQQPQRIDAGVAILHAALKLPRRCSLAACLGS